VTKGAQVAQKLRSTARIVRVGKTSKLCKSCTAQDHNFLVGLYIAVHGVLLIMVAEIMESSVDGPLQKCG